MRIESRNLLSQQFLRCASLKEYDWKHILKYLTWEEQGTLLSESVKHPLAVRFPIKLSYQVAFLKEIIDYLESENIDIHDDIYSTYCQLLTAKKKEEEFCYKHYVISDGIAVSLKESSRLISDGTTGLHSWEASLVLAEWCLQNTAELKGKRILELGSGPGLTGLVVGKCCSPRQMWLTDCHPRVLCLLEENVKLNFNAIPKNSNLDPNGKRVLCQVPANSYSDIGIINLPWEDLEGDDVVKSIVVPDIVIASDVVYDSSIFSPLCRALEYFLRVNAKCRIVLVCTVRNHSTLDDFLHLLESHSLTVSPIAIPKPHHLYWPQTVDTKMFAISSS